MGRRKTSDLVEGVVLGLFETECVIQKKLLRKSKQWAIVFQLLLYTGFAIRRVFLEVSLTKTGKKATFRKRPTAANTHCR